MNVSQLSEAETKAVRGAVRASIDLYTSHLALVAEDTLAMKQKHGKMKRTLEHLQAALFKLGGTRRNVKFTRL